MTIIDPDAGRALGHHRHWLTLLIAAIDPSRPVRVIRSVEAAQDAEPFEQPLAQVRFTELPLADLADWYRVSIATAVEDASSDIIFLAGDEALAPMIRNSGVLRRSKARVHALVFRFAAQPRRGGLLMFAVKMGAYLLARARVRNLRLYGLELPVGRRSALSLLTGFIPVTDSSASESSAPVGKAVARQDSGLGDFGGLLVVVVGVLSHGKHIDTIVNAWRDAARTDATIVFAGVADAATEAILREAAANISTVEFRAGRMSDREFDRMIEAADFSVALYRYSASSGVVLRSLASGTKVLIGGSGTLRKAFSGTPGVTVINHPSERNVTEAFRSMSRDSPVYPTVYRRGDSEFPLPIVSRLASH